MSYKTHPKAVCPECGSTEVGYTMQLTARLYLSYDPHGNFIGREFAEMDGSDVDSILYECYDCAWTWETEA